MQTLRHVVAGTDFSSPADRALDLALALATACAVPVTVVHVCELDDDDPGDRRLLALGRALAELVASRRRSGVEVTGVLRSGRPWEKLDNVAADVGAGLIVIGRHGSGRGPRVALGSVAEHLVRTASRPVLTVTCTFDR